MNINIDYEQDGNSGSASISGTDTEWDVYTSFDCVDYGTGGRPGHISGSQSGHFSVTQYGNISKMESAAVSFMAALAAVSPAVVYDALDKARR